MAPQTERATVGTDWAPPRAATWNELMDMLGDWRRMRHQLARPLQPVEKRAPSVTVRVKNATGVQLRTGEVVDLDTTPLLTDIDRNYPWFTATIPNGQRVSAIVLEPIGTDSIGLAQVAGVCPALVNFASTSDKFAAVSNGNDVLQSDDESGPVRIVTDPTSTGEQLVWVALGSTSTASAALGIPFINVSGFTIPPGGIMQVSLSTTIGSTDYYRCIRPSITFDRRWLVNGQTAVANGATSLGSWLDDLAGFAAIDPGSAHLLQSIFGWGPRPDSFLLFPAYFGFSIDGNTSYTIGGQLVAQARQHEVNKLIGLKLMDELEFDGHARAKIWHRDHLFLRRETDFAPIDLYDGFKLEDGDDPLPVGLRVDAVWNGNEWELAGAACSPVEDSQSQQSAQSQFGNGVSPQQFTSPAFPSSPSFM